MQTWKQFEETVAQSIRDNSVIFLRRAANEIANHDDRGDKAFDHETGTIVTVLTQMSLELAVASFLVKHDGLESILVKPERFTDDQIREKWLDNELRTKTFEEYRQLLEAKHLGIYSVFEDINQQFQQSRNKIMHLHFRFEEGDLYDLKFESTFMLIHIITQFIFEDDYNHSDNIASLLSPDLFKKLVRFPPYQYYVKKLAEDYSRVVLRCPICECVAFSDVQRKCFACTYEDPALRLLDCPKCSERSVTYDHLNLDINKKLAGKCLKCGSMHEVFKCTSCDCPTVGVAPYLHCAFCAEDAQEQKA